MALIFPPWTNHVRVLLGVALVGGLAYAVVFIDVVFSPKTVNQGYSPEQPVPYSHLLHAGRLGMDCRYCHSTVEETAMAALPASGTCMNCHQMVRPTSPALLPVRESAAGHTPVAWVRVHQLPDYVYFNHSAHVRRGVGCVACHERIDRMAQVATTKPLSMGWCLDCHRAPEPSLRPLDKVTAMDWVPASDAAVLATTLRQENNINPPTDCATCHR